LKEAGLGELRDIVSNFEIPECSLTLGVGSSLRDSLTVRLLNLVQKLVILKEHGATRTGSQNVCVVIHRDTCGVSED
jgi:hypothetical protein